jgi:phosphoribosylaminoimidazole-succinocarboxamide synthase
MEALRSKLHADAELRTNKYLPRISEQLKNTYSSSVLEPSSFTKEEPEKYVGKVRDRYTFSNAVVLVVSDRLSAFDRQLTEIPFKGAVLNQVSGWWFEKTKHIVNNHVIASSVHSNVTLARKCKPFPIEFVMRGYITGSTGTSMWTNYKNGVRNYCGHRLPEGLVKDQKLANNLLTPTTKEEHDALISAENIVKDGWMNQEDWDFCAKKAKEIFAFGQEVAKEHGLILVDTKYEFGRDEQTGEILLIDEMHTPDSSRYWIESSYEKCMSEGTPPQNIDKEFVRKWFAAHCDPYNDSELPEAPSDLLCELSRRYIMLYELITGNLFQFTDHDASIGDAIKTSGKWVE